MKQFSIRELERFSGVRAHTIRMWESRYNFLNPDRTESNIRWYTPAEAERLLEVALLTQAGYRISEVVHLEGTALQEALGSLKRTAQRQRRTVHQLILHMYAGEIEAFEELLDDSALSFGIDQTISSIIVPFMEKVQLLSYIDGSCEVHFVVTALRKKIIFGIESIATTAKSRTALLYLPKGEHFDLVLLYMTYLLKREGVKTLYLGTNVREEFLKPLLLTRKPDYLYTYLSSKKSLSYRALAGFLEEHLPGMLLLVATASTPEAAEEAQPHNLFFFPFTHTLDMLQAPGQRQANDHPSDRSA